MTSNLIYTSQPVTAASRSGRGDVSSSPSSLAS